MLAQHCRRPFPFFLPFFFSFFPGGCCAWALSCATSGSIPVGLELYSFETSLKKDPEATVRASFRWLSRRPEFNAPYFEWERNQPTDAQIVDDLGFVVSRRTMTVRF